jgi:hypothetical protein
MDADAIRPVLAGLIGGTIVWALISYARRSAAEERDGEIVLHFPRAVGWIGGMTALGFLTLTINSALHGSRVNSYPVAVGVPAVLACLGAFIAVSSRTLACAAIPSWTTGR